MLSLWKKLVSEDKGQGLVEYALIIGLIAVVLIVAIKDVRTAIGNVFTSIKDALTNPSGS